MVELLLSCRFKQLHFTPILLCDFGDFRELVDILLQSYLSMNDENDKFDGHSAQRLTRKRPQHLIDADSLCNEQTVRNVLRPRQLPRVILVHFISLATWKCHFISLLRHGDFTALSLLCGFLSLGDIAIVPSQKGITSEVSENTKWGMKQKEYGN